ncbi:MAG: hypothetical protein KJ645_02935, partial [Planctomycetes bacterium]|nr:hypothetical protein [Planctomycetota bacterium]
AKVIRLSHPLDFYMSGLCAAGTGAYLDEISRIENISVAEFGRIGGGYLEKYLQMLPSEDPLPMEEFSSVCTVFAKSSYIKKKALLSLEERAAAICWAQGKQIYNSMIQSLRDYTGSISFQGGVSFNHGVRLSLNHLLKQGRDASSGAEQVLIIPQIDDYRDAEGNKKQVSHLMGALGAAFLGKEHVELRKGVINPNFAKSIESRRDRVL